MILHLKQSVIKYWATQKAPPDNFAHKICVPCHSFSCMLAHLSTILVPHSLYLNFLPINPSLIVFFFLTVPKFDILMPFSRSLWTSIALLMCFPWYCQFVLHRVPSIPQYIHPTNCDAGLFLAQPPVKSSSPHNAIHNFWQLHTADCVITPCLAQGASVLAPSGPSRAHCSQKGEFLLGQKQQIVMSCVICY